MLVLSNTQNTIELEEAEQSNRYSLNDSDIILTTGDGSMNGILGRKGVYSTYHPIPIVCLLPPIMATNSIEFKQVTTGNMAAAAVTKDNKIYVWGNNDHCQISINPMTKPDLGDEDNERALEEIVSELKQYYCDLWNRMYDIIDTSKKEKIENWLQTKQVINPGTKICDVMKTNDNYHELTKKMFNKYKDTFLDELSEFVNIEVKYQPRMVLNENEKNIRDQNKLYPYNKLMYENENMKRLNDLTISTPKSKILNKKEKKIGKESANESDSDSTSNNNNNNSNNSNNSNNLDYFGSNFVKNGFLGCDRSNEEYFGFEYLQTKEEEKEQSFQSQLVCNYFTPAMMRLPAKLEIKKISMGASHLVALDHSGVVYSCGTFSVKFLFFICLCLYLALP